MKRYLVPRVLPLLFVGVLPCLMSDPSLTAPFGDRADGQSETQVERWIKDLGSDSFQEREAAMRALMKLEDEPPGLRKALQSPDLEIRRRVARLFETYISKRARRGLTKAQALAKESRVDEMVERLVLWRECDPKEEEWRAVAEFAVKLVEWEYRNFGNTRFLAKGFFPHVPSAFRRKNLSPADTIFPNELTEMWTRSPHRLSDKITLSMHEVGFTHLVILASENVRIPCLYGSIMITGGNIYMQHGSAHSIIICDEDLEVSCGFQNCLVIARGKVMCHKDSKIMDCTIFSGGPITFSGGVTVENSAILSAGPIECPKGVTVGRRSMLKASIPEQPVKFFDIEAAGLTVWQVYRNNGNWGRAPLIAAPDNITFSDPRARSDPRAGVEIKKIRKGTPFNAGLRGGDIVTAIDETKTPTKAIFRKILRRKLAEGGPLITFTVLRSGKTLDVSIPVKD
jgi:hypothetical protein